MIRYILIILSIIVFIILIITINNRKKYETYIASNVDNDDKLLYGYYNWGQQRTYRNDGDIYRNAPEEFRHNLATMIT